MEFSDLVGKTIKQIRFTTNEEGARLEMDLWVSEAADYRWKHLRLYHEQDCCEGVYLAEIIGNLDDVMYTPILKAEESTSESEPPPDADEVVVDDSYTWTFYHLVTVRGYVTLRWFGTSNGYYSEAVTFCEVPA